MKQECEGFRLPIMGRYQTGETRRYSGRRWVVGRLLLFVEVGEVQ